MGEENKATGVSKLNDSPDMNSCLYQIEKYNMVTCTYSLRFPSICIQIILVLRNLDPNSESSRTITYLLTSSPVL